MRSGRLDEGIAAAKQILEQDPKDLKALNLLGIALTSKGDLDSANREYRKALAIDPAFYHAQKNLAINELAQKDLDGAKRDLTAALKYAPNDPAIHSYLGRIGYTQRNYSEAADYLAKVDVSKDSELTSELVESEVLSGQAKTAQELLRQFPPDHFTDRQQFRIGLALADKNQFQDAVPFFQAVSAKYPESYDAAFNLALCLVESKQFPQAIEILRAAANRGHKTAELDNLLAQAYEGNNQTQDAINTLREATQLAPEDEDNFVDLAALCTNYDAFQLALDVIEVGLHNHPQSDRLIFQRGVVYAMTNKFDEAERDFQSAAQLAPEKNLSYVAIGISDMQKGDLPKAINELRHRIRQKPNDATLQYLLGEALIRAGAAPGEARFREGKLALEKSIRLNPKFAPSHADLAKLLLKENNVDAAIEHLETARKLDPSDKSSYSQLAVAYRRKGNSEKSGEMLTALNKLNEEERANAGRRKRLRSVNEVETPEAQPAR